MLNLLQKIYRHGKHRKMIKLSATFVSEELATIVNETIHYLDRDGRIKSPLHKEVLKFESTALTYWLFRCNSMFPEPLHKMTLDYMHEQYYAHLKKHGYDRGAISAVCTDLNARYKTYDQFINDSGDLTRVGASFAEFVSESAKTGLDATEIMIASILIKETTVKLKEFNEIVK